MKTLTQNPLPPVLGPLVRYLDQLTGRAPLDELSRLLQESSVSLEDLRAFVRFDPAHYRRNLVAEGQWYSLLVLCWRSGQRSPIHDHAQSACAFKVLTGVCSETAYGFSPCGQVYPLQTTAQLAGAIVATQDTDTHQVSNLQPGGCDLVTLHIYSPPLKLMQRFSITGESAGAWTDEEYQSGAGV
jgi:cysteine dioxygenase